LRLFRPGRTLCNGGKDLQRRAKDYSKPRQFLWTDTPDAHDVLSKGEQKWFTKWRTQDTSILRRFIDEGYTTLESAVASVDVDTFLADLNAALSNPKVKFPMTYWDNTGKRFDTARHERLANPESKVLDVHVRLPSSHNLIFAPELLNFLRDIFQEEPVAFQTLYFENGSQQAAHQDTAFVYTDPPYHFVASWIALEDISPDTGELFYYPGSHKMDDLLFAGGAKALRPGDPDGPEYSANLERFVAEYGFTRTRFLPKRTDVLFWASDLVHGGEPTTRQATRRSLVTHYCPRSATVPYAKERKIRPKHLPCGGWVVALY
ncbi:MAG TPA: phytanoyl-CoA dioxygenase family protein, partial [Terriglobales bacterium]|nr:phytanoyl-CoA dioxygenase family protein [Terriglobales bacterium]